MTTGDGAPTVETESATSSLNWGMVGQEHAVRALRSALATGKRSHAYLFVGPHGSGRATLARRFARMLDCEAPVDGPEGAEPCGACRPCRQIEHGDWPDVEHIAIGGLCDARDHKDHQADGSTRIRICQVRRLERVASLAPMGSPFRVFVVDTADDLQPEAAHALLKLLEEPPAASIVILLATDVQELLPTVRSRCQELTLRPLSAPALAAALVERTDIDPGEAEEIARLARGRFGFALTLHADPALRVLRETATADLVRLASEGRNERFEFARTLGMRWSRERESVLATLDIWREAWRSALHRSAHILDGGDPALDCTPAEATRALLAVQTAREHLLDNTNAQLALEVMMLDLPRLAARQEANSLPGEEGRAGEPLGG